MLKLPHFSTCKRVQDRRPASWFQGELGSVSSFPRRLRYRHVDNAFRDGSAEKDTVSGSHLNIPRPRPEQSRISSLLVSCQVSQHMISETAPLLGPRQIMPNSRASESLSRSSLDSDQLEGRAVRAGRRSSGTLKDGSRATKIRSAVLQAFSPRLYSGRQTETATETEAKTETSTDLKPTQPPIIRARPFLPELRDPLSLTPMSGVSLQWARDRDDRASDQMVTEAKHQERNDLSELRAAGGAQ